MLKYAIFLVVLISCNEKYSGDFLLQPPTGSSYQMTVTMEELNDTAVINSETMEFTLATKEKDSLNDFNFIVRKIETQQPATRIVPLENGGMMVQSTGMREILSTAAIQGNQGWYNIVPRIVNDSVLVTINRIGQIRMFTGYENIKRKIVDATGDDVRNVSPLVRRYVGEDAFTDLINRLFFYLPGKKIEPGDDWVKNTVLIEKAPVKYSHLIKVKDIKNDTVHMTVQTVVSSRMGKGGRIILEGKQHGTIRANYRTGMVIDLDLTENSVVHTDALDRNTIRRIRAALR